MIIAQNHCFGRFRAKLGKPPNEINPSPFGAFLQLVIEAIPMSRPRTRIKSYEARRMACTAFAGLVGHGKLKPRRRTRASRMSVVARSIDCVVQQRFFYCTAERWKTTAAMDDAAIDRLGEEGEGGRQG